MENIDNPILEEMYNKCKKDFFDYIYKNNQKLQNQTQVTLESLAIIYDLINKFILDKNQVALLNSKIHVMIQNYTSEYDLVAALFYKYGVVNGIKDYEKIKQEL